MLYRAIKVFAIVVSVAATHVLPASQCTAQTLPKPTGPSAVGRMTVHFVDASREDDQGTHKDRKREFMAQVWYPAEAAAETKPAPWMPADWLRLEAAGLLGTRLNRGGDPTVKDIPQVLASVVVHSREDAPVAASPRRFPVLVFSPGSLMFPSYYSSLVEDLASHGYVVIGNVPTGYVAAVPFPAGNLTRSFKKPNFPLWPGDLTYELDQLAVWNTTPGHRFFGRLDLDRVGAFGHSAGGTAVVTIASKDNRVKAIVLLDPGMASPEYGKAIPTLLLKSENIDLARRFPDVNKSATKMQNEYLRQAKPGMKITLLGAEHMSFTDLAVIEPFRRPGDGKGFNAATRAILREFFGQYLLGEHSALLENVTDKYPWARRETLQP